jgi:hypothetical protein
VPEPSAGRRAARDRAGRRRAAGIYGTIITAVVIAAGHNLRPLPLAITVLVTLLVYWLAEQYAELLAEGTHAGRLPNRAQVRRSLSVTWPMVSSCTIPLIVLLLLRAGGADPEFAAEMALLAAIGLLLAHGWTAGRAAGLHGLRLFAATSVAGALGLMVVLLKVLVMH